MQEDASRLRTLTITVDPDVYDGLHAVVGSSRISQFLNGLARPLVVTTDLVAGYGAMAADEAREAEAEAWIDALNGDAAIEPRLGE